MAAGVENKALTRGNDRKTDARQMAFVRFVTVSAALVLLLLAFLCLLLPKPPLVPRPVPVTTSSSSRNTGFSLTSYLLRWRHNNRTESTPALPAALASASSSAELPLIPGSRITSANQLRAFRSRLACLSANATWQLDRTPRTLPWTPVHDYPSLCDEKWVFGPGHNDSRYKHVAFKEADDIALAGGSAEEWNVRDAVKYKWQPEGRCGEWDEFDRRRLAEKLEGKTVLIVGDSLNVMMFESLKNNLEREPMPTRNTRQGNQQGNQSQEQGATPLMPSEFIPAFCENRTNHPELQVRPRLKPCRGISLLNSTFISIRDDVISTDLNMTVNFPTIISLPWFDVLTGEVGKEGKERRLQERSGERRMQRWLIGQQVRQGEEGGGGSQEQQEWQLMQGNEEMHRVAAGVGPRELIETSRNEQDLPPVSVLVLNRGAHFRNNSVFLAELNNTLTTVRAAAPNVLIIYRSTPPGHKDCGNFSAPLTKHQDPSMLPYNWGDFPEQNEIARSLVEAVGGVFLDVVSMTIERPDGHMAPPGDCLHYCLPGPPDEWVRLLYHVLLDAL